MREVPMASEIVMMEDRASGIAATASATANSSASSTGICRSIASPKTTAQMIMIATDSFLLKLSIVICSGVLRSLVSLISSAMRPSSVSLPTAVTTQVARP